MSDDSILTPEHIKTIARFMVSGGLMGAGVGGASALINYLRNLNRDTRSDDDDTLYIYRDPSAVKSAAADAWSHPIEATGEAAGRLAKWLAATGWDVGKSLVSGIGEGAGAAADEVSNMVANPTTAGLADVAALVSALGGYSLIKKLHAKYEKDKAQDELDKAQMTYLEGQGYKKASADEPVNLSGIDHFGGLTVALPLILMLAAGAGTKKYLDMQYPITKKMPKEPRRIEVIDKPDSDAAEYDEPSETYNKTASATELALHLIDQTGSDRSDVRNLISAIARDGVTEFKKAAQNAGFFNALELVKGASASESSPEARHVAITYLAHSPAMATQVGVVAAGEVAEMFPSLYKTAYALDEQTSAALVGVAEEVGSAIRAERAFDLGMFADDVVKSAAAGAHSTNAADSMEKWLNANAGKLRPATRGDEDESTGTSGEEAGIVDPNSPSRPTSMKQLLMTGKTGRTHTDSSKLDVIDQFLNPQRKQEEDTTKSTEEHGKGFMSPTV